MFYFSVGALAVKVTVLCFFYFFDVFFSKKIQNCHHQNFTTPKF